ncbi:MAG: SUMF1/EgtB/PvdO family nonheme iron enzyme [Verrucomicrobia bacterium]|nr:SUMF1/EgtB/PvdO family nonheme iron enzyme [Verrucomicrobiota bacterium]
MFRDVTAAVARDTKEAQEPWIHQSVRGRFYFTPIDVLDDNLDLTAGKLARYKKLLAEQQAAEAQMKQLEDQKNASIAQMERQIESLRKKLSQPGAAGGTLDQLVALGKQREQYQRDLDAAKVKAEQERRQRAAEMAELRAQETANRKKKFDAAYAKYRWIADSKYMRDAEKKQAWTLICSNWNVTDAADAPGILFWDDQTGIVSGKPAGPAPGQNLVVDLGGGVDMELAWIEPGSFMMGSPTSEESRGSDEAQHRVTLSKGFWMGKYEVTQEQWEQVMGRNPSNFKGVKNPVEQVSWADCQGFLQKLNGTGVEGNFRLPTEAEWEYACRAGTTTVFHYGEDLDASMANFNGNYPYGRGRKGEYRKKTVQVGSFKPNAWGLYDMHGNVWEWCQDWYGDYPSGGATDPRGASSGSGRVLRGGSWYVYARDCRSASRVGSAPSVRGFVIGFRVLLFR